MRYEELINEERWERMVRYVADQFEEVTIMRGFQYFKQGRVEGMQEFGEGEIRAIVTGTEDYIVSIALDNPRNSRCDCPYGWPCKHMVAALMAIAERADRPVHTLANAKVSAALLSASASPGGPKSGRGSALGDAERLAPELPNMSVSQWHDWFALCALPLADHTRNPYYVKQAWANFQRWKPKLPRAADRLFELNANLFLLSKLTSESFLGYFTNIAAADTKQAALQCLQTPLEAEPEQKPRLLETADYVRRRMIFKSPHSAYFSDLYFELWSRWIAPQDLEASSEELRALEASEGGLGADLNRDAWLTARSWIHLLRTEDREAWELLNEARQPVPGDVLRMLRQLAASEDWKRLADWLEGSAALFSGYRFDVLGEYSRCWDTVVAHRPEEEERMWSAIAAQLPRSGRIYEEKLHSFGRWRGWIDYQLSAGRDPLDYRATELAPIEKDDPDALLPFYHQAVERYVQLRNRDGYKQAVKLLKRMAKLYKKTKRDERWNFFFETFVERHSRLRALQEELRKGKLL